MKLLAWLLWTAAVIWLAFVVMGALRFQDLYGGSAGVQVALLGLVVALVPAGVGWWAYRRSE